MTTEHATVNRIDTEGKSTAILVVDDEPDILFFVVHALQCMGMTVACAGNGEQALSLLATRPFAVMLTDLNMPGINGPELARQARGLQPLLTIILGTGHLSRGYTNKRHRPESVKSSANHSKLKPSFGSSARHWHDGNQIHQTVIKTVWNVPHHK